MSYRERGLVDYPEHEGSDPEDHGDYNSQDSWERRHTIKTRAFVNKYKQFIDKRREEERRAHAWVNVPSRWEQPQRDRHAGLYSPDCSVSYTGIRLTPSPKPNEESRLNSLVGGIDSLSELYKRDRMKDRSRGSAFSSRHDARSRSPIFPCDEDREVFDIVNNRDDSGEMFVPVDWIRIREPEYHDRKSPRERRRSPSHDRDRLRSPSYDRNRHRSPSHDRDRGRSPSYDKNRHYQGRRSPQHYEDKRRSISPGGHYYERRRSVTPRDHYRNRRSVSPSGQYHNRRRSVSPRSRHEDRLSPSRYHDRHRSRSPDPRLRDHHAYKGESSQKWHDSYESRRSPSSMYNKSSDLYDRRKKRSPSPMDISPPRHISPDVPPAPPPPILSSATPPPPALYMPTDYSKDWLLKKKEIGLQVDLGLNVHGAIDVFLLALVGYLDNLLKHHVFYLIDPVT